MGKKGVFKFGRINLKDHTYDAQQPFGAAFYKAVMSKQWFDSLKSKAFLLYKGLGLIILIQMENSLKEWATGVHIQIKFTKEEFGPRYWHHRATLLNLQQKSPTWFAQFQHNLYAKIVSTSNFPHLKKSTAEPKEDELDGVNFDALEASATNTDITDTVEAAALALVPAPVGST
ncbi:hypothetical protein DFH07DRAFT_781640 [Mycena maculata]|uniref:DUF6532 domain-containing protein n=1 Tax=Mycena maculata TaxID=230809 RepID=A0AAD7HXK6_9AGAR|nr:hypothetical protein DFH07DRAFT_781640 [Mycena maculata]